MLATKKSTSTLVITLLLAVAFLAGSALVPAQDAVVAASEPQQGGTIVIAKDDEAPGLDPHKMPATSAIRVFEHIYNSLVTLDKDMSIQPSLAESWDVSDDGQTYTFHLREGVKFHNGREMTSADVKYSFERMLAEETGALVRSFFAPVLDGVTTPDDYTVVFELNRPNAPFLNNVASFWAAIVPQEVVEANDGDLSRVAVGTGPFTLGEWVQDSHLVLNRFDDHFAGAAHVDAIRFVVLKDEAARTAAVRTGQVDMSPVSAHSAQQLQGRQGLEIAAAPSLRYFYLGLNHDVEPLNNKQVRQAIALAMDRQQLIDVAFGGDAILTGPTPPALRDWAIPGEDFELNHANLERARELLAEAGYGNGFTIELTSASSRDDLMDLAQLIQAQLGQIGINVRIDAVEWGTYVNTWIDKSMEMMVGSNGGGTDIDRSLHFYWASDGGANVWNYANPELDALIEQARQEADPAARYAPYAAAQEIVVDDVVNVFLLSPNNFVAIRDNVQNFTPMPNEQNLYLLETWLSDN